VSIVTNPIRNDAHRPRTDSRPRITASEPIDDLASDYERAVVYRGQAEAYRDQWMAGRRREIAYVMNRAKAGDARFKRMSANELEVTGRWRWSRSAEANRLAGQEQLFRRWAQMYLEFAEFGPQTKHL
jgi:hypothetical protein